MRWMIGVVLMVSSVFAGEALPAKESFHIYLLCGQSNMAGRGKVEEQDKVAHPRVKVFNEQKEWAPALDPLHWDKPKIAGVGLGSSFGRAMAERNAKVTIGLVPCAVGGTPIERWTPDGDLFKQAVARAKAAGASGTIKGILWHQGESNVGLSTEEYGAKLQKVVEGFRKELGQPDLFFVVGTLADFNAKKDNVNAALKALPTKVPNTACVESMGLVHHGDGTHFDSASLREFGKRYAGAFK